MTDRRDPQEDGAQQYLREQVTKILGEREDEAQVSPLERLSRGFAENDNARKREQEEENHE